MKHFREYIGHKAKIEGKRKKIDNNVYSFDIETTSYITLDGKVYSSYEYLKLDKREQKECIKGAFMYIWMFSINEDVYYGRTWEEFKIFLKNVDNCIPEKKYLFIHNLGFEFQFLRSHFDFENVIARKKHKVMSADMVDYNFTLRCSYFMTNCKLSEIPKNYNLDISKKVGDLDYSLLRNSKTVLTDKELGYCENDVLIIYYYILEEIKEYGRVDKIPMTSTGHVRRELKNIVLKDVPYRRKVNKAINTNPHIYNLLVECFAGGYTHSNYFYTDEVLYNVSSYDFTSSYPYVMVAYKFPSKEFKECTLKDIKYMSKNMAYILVVRFKNIKCKYNNTFISANKCRRISKASYDNGRIIEAEEIEIVLTDIDFRFILDSYIIESYEIVESYYSIYDYLPKTFIEFILSKYIKKTEYKGIEEKKLEYMKEKNKFNALYGMSVTNTIRDNVIYDNDKGWSEEELKDDEIIEKLQEEKKQSFLSFAYGVWVTAYARNNLLQNVIKLDDYVVYCDTDSMKLLEGYDKKVIDDYNESVVKRIENVSKTLEIDINKYKPKDVKGKERLLGVFDFEGVYEEFITQGAKKYAYKENGTIEITVAGVPKNGKVALKSLDEFRDNLVFDFKDTNKLLLMYVENQEEIEITDYQGNKVKVTDKTGACLLPTTYVLGKALEYADLVNDASSKRAVYKGE